MNNKNRTTIIVSLAIIAIALILGIVYLLANQESSETEPLIINEREVDDILPTDHQGDIIDTEEKVAEPVFESGETVLISRNDQPWKCSPNGDSCEEILVTTEIELTEASMGDQLTGLFFIRAYNGTDYRNSPKIGELQITQNYNPFAGDGGTPFEKDTEQVLTINAYEKSQTRDELRFKDRFYLEFMGSVSDWGDSAGYMLRLENVKESNFNGQWIDFYYSNGVVNISPVQ